MDKNNTSLIFQLLKTSQLIKKKIHNEIPENLSNLPFELLSHLQQSPQSLTSLTQKMQCSKQETSRKVQRAEKHGWIIVETDQKDKRGKKVSLTKDAKKLLQQGAKYYQSIEKQWQKELTTHEIKNLTSTLNKIGKLID